MERKDWLTFRESSRLPELTADTPSLQAAFHNASHGKLCNTLALETLAVPHTFPEGRNWVHVTFTAET